MPRIKVTHCYDFPNVVIHRDAMITEGEAPCPRYTGGQCRPLPTPLPPYTEEQAEAVARATHMEDYQAGRASKPFAFLDDEAVIVRMPSSAYKRNLPPGRVQ